MSLFCRPCSAAKTAEASAFPEFKDPGDAVQIAKSAPMPVVADLPVAGDPVSLAQTVQSPDQATPKEAGDPVALADTVKLAIISELDSPAAPDLFTISRTFLWQMPQGQFMSQLLKDIDAAKARGDTKQYEELTKRYTTWAEKYLSRDERPKIKGLRGH